MSELKVLLVGIDAEAEAVLRSSLNDVGVEKVADQQTFEQKFESWADGQFVAIFIGGAMEGVSGSELAQVANTQCPGSPKFFVTSDRSKFDPKSLMKNGCGGCYLLPTDAEILKRLVSSKVLSAKDGYKDFRPVKVFDIDPESNLDYDIYVYLPLNGKRIRFASKENAIGKDRHERLQNKHHNSVLIDSQDLPKFYRQSAQKLRALGGMSSTESQEKLNEAVRSVILEIFDQSSLGDFTEAKKYIETCQGMISNYITKGGSSDWYKRLLAALGESDDVYNHAANVSTFCALFGIAAGYPNPEELAIAGLFHDIGISELPVELGQLDYAAMTEDQKKLYQTHVQLSLDLLKKKRIIVSPVVEKAILQHHETYDGRGYPKALSSNRFSIEGQILSFADQFDELTRIVPGRKRITPAEALALIQANNSISAEVVNKISRSILETGKKAS